MPAIMFGGKAEASLAWRTSRHNRIAHHCHRFLLPDAISAKMQAGPASLCALPACDRTVSLKQFVTLQMATTSRASGKRQAASPAHSTVSVLPTVAPAVSDPSTTLQAHPHGPPHQSEPEATSPFEDSFEAASAASGPAQPSHPQASAHDVTPPSPDTLPAGATCEGWVAFGMWEDVTSRDGSCSLTEAGTDSPVSCPAAMSLDTTPGTDESGEEDWATSWDDPTSPPSDALCTRAEPDDIDRASTWDMPPNLPEAPAPAQLAESHGSDDIDWAHIWDAPAPHPARAHYRSRKPKGLCIELDAPLAPPSPHARLRSGVVYNRFKLAFCEQRMALAGRIDSFTTPPAPYSFLMGAQDALKPAPACQSRQSRRSRLARLAKACVKRICICARKPVCSAPEETDRLLWSYEDLCPATE